MKHAIIFAHPNAQSFTGAVAAAYQDAAQGLGHGTISRDLYRMGFDPLLKSAELPADDKFLPSADVAAERVLLADCDVFVMVYPLWLNAPPAMMKGYLERVFGFGFAYGGSGHSSNPLLSGRKLISFSSSGAPLAWVRQTGAFDAICKLFDDYFADLCGLAALEHVHFGGIVPGASGEFVRGRLEEVKKTVVKHFGRPS